MDTNRTCRKTIVKRSELSKSKNLFTTLMFTFYLHHRIEMTSVFVPPIKVFSWWDCQPLLQKNNKHKLKISCECSGQETRNIHGILFTVTLARSACFRFTCPPLPALYRFSSWNQTRYYYSFTPFNKTILKTSLTWLYSSNQFSSSQADSQRSILSIISFRLCASSLILFICASMLARSSEGSTNPEETSGSSAREPVVRIT